jgi:hypothetical protein
LLGVLLWIRLTIVVRDETMKNQRGGSYYSGCGVVHKHTSDCELFADYVTRILNDEENKHFTHLKFKQQHVVKHGGMAKGRMKVALQMYVVNALVVVSSSLLQPLLLTSMRTRKRRRMDTGKKRK